MIHRIGDISRLVVRSPLVSSYQKWFIPRRQYSFPPPTVLYSNTNNTSKPFSLPIATFRQKRYYRTSPTTPLRRYVHTSAQNHDLQHLHHLSSHKDHALARSWVDGFKLDHIPKESLEITRSRSSGPGGQHVNKTESKVTIRLDLTHAQERWLPPFVIPALENSPHYHPTPPTLLVSSQQSRSATQNHQTALLILYNTILSSAESLIINPTSSEQRAKVKGFVKRENERRLEGKKRNGAKKAARRDFD
ncbi:hypothetical protein CI109_100688 [Kwoniella shandongensis]|uniref:Prokaryotic-type class I peptide chain release factors domain-containing protein n=1 Tax=Kwoniella shandongensis TaxID=1734106 RepID=A0AAJ8LE88_9TREE